MVAQTPASFSPPPIRQEQYHAVTHPNALLELDQEMTLREELQQASPTLAQPQPAEGGDALLGDPPPLNKQVSQENSINSTPKEADQSLSETPPDIPKADSTGDDSKKSTGMNKYNKKVIKTICFDAIHHCFTLF